MTPAQLLAACRLAGGITPLARLIGKKRVYLNRRLTPLGSKMSEPYPISLMDELAILKALKLKSVNQLDTEQPTKEGTAI